MTAVTLRFPRLYPKQKAAVFTPERFSIIEASTKSGKTISCICWLLAQAWTAPKPNRNYWWIAPTLPVAKIAFRRMKNMLLRTDLRQEFWTANLSDCTITLKNRACLWFKGADRPDLLYGEDVFAAVIDEASRAKAEAWYAVRSTLTATEGSVRVIGNVRGRKNWAYQLARLAESGAPHMAYFRLTALDAIAGGVLKTTEIDDAKRQLPPAVFQELFMAEASDDGSNPFGMDAIRACTIDALDSGPPEVFGIDLARKQDWLWVIGLNKSGGVCYSDRWQADWEQSHRRILDAVRDTPALIDATGLGDPVVARLQTAAPLIEGYIFSGPSKQRLMEGLAAALQRRELRIPAGLLTTELESFGYEYTKTGVRYATVAGMTDDGVMALALAVQHRPLYRELPPVYYESAGKASPGASSGLEYETVTMTI